LPSNLDTESHGHRQELKGRRKSADSVLSIQTRCNTHLSGCCCCRLLDTGGGLLLPGPPSIGPSPTGLWSCLAGFRSLVTVLPRCWFTSITRTCGVSARVSSRWFLRSSGGSRGCCSSRWLLLSYCLLSCCLLLCSTLKVGLATPLPGSGRGGGTAVWQGHSCGSCKVGGDSCGRLSGRMRRG